MNFRCPVPIIMKYGTESMEYSLIPIVFPYQAFLLTLLNMLKEHLRELVTLFDPRTTIIVRGNVSALQPVFMYDKGVIRASFSNYEYNHVIASKQSQEGFALIDA